MSFEIQFHCHLLHEDFQMPSRWNLGSIRILLQLCHLGGTIHLLGLLGSSLSLSLLLESSLFPTLPGSEQVYFVREKYKKEGRKGERERGEREGGVNTSLDPSYQEMPTYHRGGCRGLVKTLHPREVGSPNTFVFERRWWAASAASSQG